MSTIGFGREEISEYFLTLTGNNGTGKSHLLQALSWEVLHNEFVVKYVYAPEFLSDLRRTFDKGNSQTFDAVFESYKTPYLLVVDDLGRGHISDWGAAQMESLIDHRYRHELKTAFGTNFDQPHMAEKLGSMVADRVFDTGSGAALVAHLGGASYRTGRNWQ